MPLPPQPPLDEITGRVKSKCKIKNNRVVQIRYGSPPQLALFYVDDDDLWLELDTAMAGKLPVTLYIDAATGAVVGVSVDDPTV